MRYTESKQRSTELLRAALSLMGQHDAAFNPTTFAVFYEHAAGTNSGLSRAIEECARAQPRLDDAAIERLHRDHVSEIDEQAVQRASGDLERVMSGVAESAARTGDRAGQFGQVLNGLQAALTTPADPSLEPMMNRVLEGTAAMRDSAAALQQQVAASSQEIERLRVDLTRARDEALIDPLTRARNRKGFDQSLDAMLRQPPDDGAAHCLVLFDIDRFKAVNDTYGHVMGDRVLQAVAEVLRTVVEASGHSVARYGGEEFAVVLPNTSLDQALPIAQACRQRVSEMKVRDRRTQNIVLKVTLSGGVAALQPNEDATTLLTRADAALYAAKQAGRNQIGRA